MTAQPTTWPGHFKRIVDNMRRTKKPTHVASTGLWLLRYPAASLCSWCVDKDASIRFGPQERFATAMGGGECERCSYAGANCLLVDLLGLPEAHQ